MRPKWPAGLQSLRWKLVWPGWPFLQVVALMLVQALKQEVSGLLEQCKTPPYHPSSQATIGAP